MRKKDYDLIARAFPRMRQMTYTDNKTVESVARELAYLLGKNDPKFDIQKFLTACGIDSHVCEPDSNMICEIGTQHVARLIKQLLDYKLTPLNSYHTLSIKDDINSCLFKVEKMYNVAMVNITVNTDECWHFAGNISNRGYGTVQAKWGGKYHTQFAHKVMYELYKGKMPEELITDHLCRVRRCINPDHLEAVTYRENFRRGIQYMEDKSHCKHGHEWLPETTYRHTNGTRICKVCRRDYVKKRKELGIWDDGRRPKV